MGSSLDGLSSMYSRCTYWCLACHQQWGEKRNASTTCDGRWESLQGVVVHLASIDRSNLFIEGQKISAVARSWARLFAGGFSYRIDFTA